MIIVKPTAGLCNRMRVINSVLHLAIINQQEKIKLLWQREEVLNADFRDLFQPIDLITLVERSQVVDYFLFYRNKQHKALKSKLKKTILGLQAAGYEYYDDVNIKDLRYNTLFWSKKHRNVVFDTCYDFYEYSKSVNYYHLFKPIPAIETRIQEQVSQFKQWPTVGIHIRRTDNLVSIQNSGIDLFVARVEEILRTNDQTRFYLATDDVTVEQLFLEKFGDRFFFQINKELNRDSKKGIEDAVVDLFCLSQTDFVLGSYWSSFSLVAAWINNIPLEIVK